MQLKYFLRTVSAPVVLTSAKPVVCANIKSSNNFKNQL